WSAYACAGRSYVGLVLSDSMLAFRSLFAVLAVGWLLRYMRTKQHSTRRILVASVVAAAIGLYFIDSHFAAVAAFLDRDVTLTGRTTIWGASLILGMDHPWIGHGFNAFWLGDEGSSGEVRKLAGWDVPSAHNGYLEIWLDLGICGLAAFF